MAWPWKNRKKKLSAPKPALSKKHEKAEKRVHQRISKKIEQVSKTVKEKDVSRHVPKLLADVAALSKLANRVEALEKNHKALNKEIDVHRTESLDEIKSINKNLGPLYDKDTAQGKEISGLKADAHSLGTEIEKVEKKVKDAKDIVLNIEGAYSIDALKRLKQGIAHIESSFKTLYNKDASMLKGLQRIDRRIAVVERHSARVDAEKAAIKESADALAQYAQQIKETVGGYSDQLVELSSKVSATIGKTADMDAQLRVLLARLQTAEGQQAALGEISQLLDKNSKLLAELALRLDYLEKATIKTIVVD